MVTMVRFFSGGTKICNKMFRIGVTLPPLPPPFSSKIQRCFPLKLPQHPWIGIGLVQLGVVQLGLVQLTPQSKRG